MSGTYEVLSSKPTALVVALTMGGKPREWRIDWKDADTIHMINHTSNMPTTIVFKRVKQ